MISAQARSGFDRLFDQAVRAALAPSPEERWELRVLAGPGEISGRKVVMLTITSYLFRTVVFLHFTLDLALKEHLARIGQLESVEQDERVWMDVMREVGNIACGQLNRDLARFYPHVGMSTPDVLERASIDSIAALRPQHQRHVALTLNDSVQVQASLCVCAAAALDFTVDAQASTDNVGELELF